MDWIILIVVVGLLIGLIVLARQQKLTRKRLRTVQSQIQEMDELRRRRWADACSTDTMRLLAAQGRSPRMPLAWRSASGEDTFVWMALGKPINGTYVEVGAHDGLDGANSFALDAMGWSGVLIEPIQQAFDACKAARPHAVCVRAACSKRGSTGEATFTHVVGGERDEQLSYLNGTDQAGRDNHLLKHRSSQFQQVSVPLSWMDKVLEGHVQRLDVAFIDVEGAEADLFDGFSLDQFKPRILVVEDLVAGGNRAARSQLEAAGYVIVHRLAFNDIWVHSGDAGLLAEMRRLAQVF